MMNEPCWASPMGFAAFSETLFQWRGHQKAAASSVNCVNCAFAMAFSNSRLIGVSDLKASITIPDSKRGYVI